MEIGRGIGIYFFLAVLVGIVLLLVYPFNLQLTGFAVSEQQEQAEFNGTYENVFYDTNASAIVLNVSQTSGTYTSRLFDAGNNSMWNNLTWTGNGDLVFEVMSCVSLDCANESFASANLDNLNLTSQYFQYKVLFTEDPNLTVSLKNVSIDYSVLGEQEQIPENVTVSISEPNGTKSSQTGIPITFTTTGENLTCWYNLDNGENTTLDNCAGSSFNAPDDGNYVFNLYANNSLGFDSQSSTFSVDTPPPSSSSNEESSSEESSSSESIITGTAQVTVQLTLSEVQDLDLSPGDVTQLSLSSSNTAITPITSCVLTSIGDFADWISPPTGEQNLNPGDEIVYNFDLAIPENQEIGQYGLTLQVKCANFIQKEDFLVNVIAPLEPESEEEISAEVGSPVGGFAIFGEGGIVTGGVVFVLIIVILVLAAIIFVVRNLRRSGKTLKDVFNDFNLNLILNKFKFRRMQE